MADYHFVIKDTKTPKTWAEWILPTMLRRSPSATE
jgi:hypothetical protein